MKIGGLQKFSLIDFPKHLSCILFTIGCNFRCPYCHNPELVDETSGEISMIQILEFLSNRKGKIEGVVITGGEPTMHDDLPSFITTIKNMGYMIKLDTNGTNPDMIKHLLEEKLLDYIAMDIKSPIDLYSKNVARAINSGAIRKSIKIIKLSKIDYEFRTTVVKSLLSEKDIEQIGKEISGAKKYYLQKFVSNKILNPQFKSKVSYTDAEFQVFKNKLLKYVKYCDVR